MKLYIQKLILCSLFVVSCNVIFSAAREGDDASREAEFAHAKGIACAASDAIEEFRDLYTTGPKNPALEAHKKTVEAIRDAGSLLVFSSKDRLQAQACIVYGHTFISRGHQTTKTTPAELLAGFAQLDCNINDAKTTLHRVYTRYKIPNANQRPFDAADEYGKWEKLPLPAHLTSDR